MQPFLRASCNYLGRPLVSELGPEPPAWGVAREGLAGDAMLRRAEAELLGLDPAVELLLSRLAGDLAVRRTARDSLLVALMRGEDGAEQRELFGAADQDVRRLLAELHDAMHPDTDTEDSS